MAAVCLDTNVAIKLLTNLDFDESLLSRYSRVCISYVVVGELLFGALNSERTASNLLHYKTFINKTTVLYSNMEVARQYAEIRVSLKKSGKPIPENDIWIAAVALAYEMPLLSLDKHLRYVNGLTVETPEL